MSSGGLVTMSMVSLCALCGQPLAHGASLCPRHHEGVGEAGWAAVNRIMCDFFHRGIATPRLSPAELIAHADSRAAAEAA
jgi:hypothetical protein